MHCTVCIYTCGLLVVSGMAFIPFLLSGESVLIVVMDGEHFNTYASRLEVIDSELSFGTRRHDQTFGQPHRSVFFT